MNMNADHDWVTGYRDFEAVLSCLNELSAWDREASLRAYQTYAWNDASTNGDELVFAHEETGVIVRHDGGVVAIDFSGERLSEALPDLFHVLFALGWRVAEVYHPAETIPLLLNDMGRAIPANMALDVKPAAAVASIAHVPESAALVSQGRALMGDPSASENFHQLALAQLTEFGEAAGFNVAAGADSVVTQKNHTGPASSFGFAGSGADDWSFVQDDFGQVPGAAPTGEGHGDLPPSLGHATSAGDSFLDDDPGVFVLPVPGAPARGEVDVERSTAQAFSRSVETGAGDRIVSVALAEVPTAQAPAAGRETTAQKPDVRLSRLPSSNNGAEMESKDAWRQHCVTVGRSVLCFDFPESPLPAETLSDVSQIVGSGIVDHVWPGAIDQRLRWDVLGELDVRYPWFAESLAEALGVGPRGRAILASMLMKMCREGRRAQLRDVIQACAAPIAGLTSAGIVEDQAARLVDGFASGYAEDLQAVFIAFGGLLICPEGGSFVDVPVEVTEQAPAAKSFTLAGLKESPAGRVLVIHIDSTDSTTVRNIAILLQAIARLVGTSVRGQKLQEAARHEAQARKEREEFVAKSIKEVEAVLEQLRSIGVEQ